MLDHAIALALAVLAFLGLSLTALTAHRRGRWQPWSEAVLDGAVFVGLLGAAVTAAHMMGDLW